MIFWGSDHFEHGNGWGLTDCDWTPYLKTPDNHFAWTAWPLKMGPIGCPETSVRNYHYSMPSKLRKVRRYNLQRGASLKSRSLTGYSVIQGDSVARDPKLLSIKNYVIEIITWKFIDTYRERCKTGAARNRYWNWSPFTSKHTWMRFFKFWNTFPKVSTLTAWISWRIASLSCSIVLGVFLCTLPFNRPQRKKSAGVRSGDLGGQRFLEIILSWKKKTFNFSHARIWSVTCCTLLLVIPSS